MRLDSISLASMSQRETTDFYFEMLSLKRKDNELDTLHIVSTVAST